MEVESTIREVTEAAALDMRRGEEALLALLAEATAPDPRGSAARASAIRALLGALDLHDPDGGKHSRAVHDLAVAVAHEFGVCGDALAELAAAALLHDVGRLALAARIPARPWSRTEEEEGVLRERSRTGEYLLRVLPGLENVATAVRDQHERWDGGGRPDRAAGEAIPLAARVVAVCDAFHTYVSERPGSSARAERDAVARILAERGGRFDPAVVDAFVATVGLVGAWRATLGDDDERREALALRRCDPGANELEALVHVAGAAAGAHRVEDVLEAVAEQTRRALGAASVSIRRYERAAGVFRTLINVGELGPGEHRFPVDERYSVEDHPRLSGLLLRGESYLSAVGDPDGEPASEKLLCALGKESQASVPIIHDGRVWGELWAASCRDRAHFGAREIRLLEAIAGQVSSTIGRADQFTRMTQLAFEDPLTGLANRRALDERLEAAFNEARARGSDLSLVLCDVDEFKSLNDRLGHARGDQVLRRVADALSAAAATHAHALVARSGGDEFCIVLPDEGSSGAERYARDAARLVRTALPDLTLSFGAAWVDAGVERVAELYRLADAAQYTAKREGGGRICATRAEAPLLPASLARGAERRTLRDATSRADELVPATVAALDALPQKASTLDRLEIVALATMRAVEAAAWSVSLAPGHGAELHTLRGMESDCDLTSGLRVIEVASDEAFSLEDYPATGQALAASGGFSASVEDPHGDAAERRLLVTLGYRALLAAAATDAQGRWLVEVFGDQRTPPMADRLPQLRALVSHAVASAPQTSR